MADFKSSSFLVSSSSSAPRARGTSAFLAASKTRSFASFQAGVAAEIVVQEVLALVLLVAVQSVLGGHDRIVLDVDLLEVHGVHAQQVPLDPVLELRGDLAGIDVDDVDGVLVRIADVVLIALVADLLADDQGGQGLAFLVLQGDPRADARIARLDRVRVGIDDAVLVVQPADVVLVEVPAAPRPFPGPCSRS